ncbi:NAD(P)/FAD-dependent oxidoreductase [Nonomuraea angiospora]|uniref:NAD(P)/FAD-dependent oxidoreductase n=1 Tax=Nonomuraea angiospora TaxID=46172 RepID=UPI00341DC44A
MLIKDADVVVIGGGPAGSAFATMASRAGLTVDVLEGKEFPRHHIGESLLAMSMPLLETLGLVPHLDEADFLPKTGAVFVWGERRQRVDLGMPEPHRAYQVRRAHFDLLLLEHARTCGARVHTSQWVKSVERGDDGRVSAVTSDGEHGAIRHRPRLTVDASGLFQFLPKKLGLGVDVSGPRRVALSGYYTGAGRLTGGQETDIITEAARDGWLWFIPLDGETTSVGFVGDEEDLSGAPDEMLAAQIATTGLVRDLVETATPTGRTHLLRYTNHIASGPLWQDGRLLIGDSALFVDPLFSTGVHGALFSAVTAAAAMVSHLVDGMEEQSLADWYDAAMRSHYHRVQTMVRLLYGINGRGSRFWASRDLSRLSHADAETMAAQLGPISVPLFLTGHRAGTLDLPETLVPLLEEFTTAPDPFAEVTGAGIALAPGVEVRGSFTRRGDRVLPALAVRDPRNRRPAVSIPEREPAAAFVRRLAAGPIERGTWSDDTRLRRLVSVLSSSRLVVEDTRVSSGAA